MGDARAGHDDRVVEPGARRARQQDVDRLGRGAGHQAGRDRLDQAAHLAPDELATARPSGRISSANSVIGGATMSRADGSRSLAPTMSVSTPVVVALAATAATASTTIQTQETTQRSASTGLRIRRSSRSST